MTNEKRNAIKKEAQKYVLDSVLDSLKFSVDFYEKEIVKELLERTTSDHMLLHYEEMQKANLELLNFIKHFKF